MERNDLFDHEGRKSQRHAEDYAKVKFIGPTSGRNPSKADVPSDDPLFAQAREWRDALSLFGSRPTATPREDGNNDAQ